jgi:tetratricopeptide (TPR) repeat protein
MDNLHDLRAQAGKLEAGGHEEAALTAYLRFAEAADPPPDAGLWSKIGRLQLRADRPGDAVQSLERASVLFQDAGLRNNALALCHLLLRAEPDRADLHLRVAQLSAVQGYQKDARGGYLEFAELKQAAGEDDAAVDALREYLGYFPGDSAVRERLAALGGELAPPPADRGVADHVAMELAPPLAAESVEEASGIAPLEGFEPTHAAEWDEAEPEPRDSLPLLDSAPEWEPDAAPAGVGALDDATEQDADEHEDEHNDEEDLPLLGFEMEPPLPEMKTPEHPDPPADSAAEEEAADPLLELRARLQLDPVDLETHQALVALLEQRSAEEDLATALDEAAAAAAACGDHALAADYAARLSELRPDDLAALQRTAEHAFRSGDRPRLVAAYLALGGHLEAVSDLRHAQTVYQRVLRLDPGNQAAMQALHALAPPAPAGDPYVDFGALVLGEEESTRFRVEAGFPTGDEERDFEEILDVFRQQVLEKIDEQDSASNYDLGVAFKEMGLWDDAIAQLQRALRGGAELLPTLEVLGECYAEKGDHALAVRVLERAAQLPQVEPRALIGVHYLLGRSQQALGATASAREYFQRVVAVDPAFRDVEERLRALG